MEQLHAQGRPPFEVARRMMSVGFESFSTKQDCVRYSRYGEPTLTSQLAAELGWDSASYEAAKSEADRILRERIVLKRMLAIGLCSGV